MTSIGVLPREFQVAKDNPVAPVIKGTVIAAVLLVAITFWRRRRRAAARSTTPSLLLEQRPRRIGAVKECNYVVKTQPTWG